MNKEEFANILEKYQLNEVDKDYFESHKERFNIMVNRLKELVQPGQRIANIGLSIFDLIAKEIVKSSGASYYSIIPNANYLNNFSKEFVESVDIVKADITNSQTFGKLIGTFDIVMFLETIEHLFYNDDDILNNVSSLIKNGGKMMFSVPNAVEIGKRFRTMFGKNPYWSKELIINGVYGGYGHIREYTLSEIRTLLNPYFTVKIIEKLNPYGSSIKRHLLNILPITWSTHIYCECEKK